MSLTRHFTNNEMSRALDHMLSHPRSHQFLSITENIKVELNGAFPSNHLRLYSYEAESATYWFAQRNFDIIRKRTTTVADGKIVDAELEEAFLVYNVEERLTDHQQRLSFACDSKYGEKLMSLITKHGGHPIEKVLYCLRFYMTPQEIKQAEDYELLVPEGYELGSATLADADFINSLWPHAQKGDDIFTRQKVSCLPSSIVRHNGEIVAFMIVDPTGVLSNQWVKPDFRRIGLGRLVEMDLSKKMIRKGYIPFKQVLKSNVPVMNSAIRSKFFTVATLEDGSIQDLIYAYF